jgi:hypothetical protein
MCQKFGVAADPPITECVARLIAKPPQSKGEAKTLFLYFSTRISELSQANVVKLSDARIVPMFPKGMTVNGFADEKAANKQGLNHLTPKQCYLGISTTYGEIFEFVDFGPGANAFLLRCGSKVEPTKPELALMLCKEPARILGTMGTPEKYKTLLRALADDLPILKKDKLLFKQMKAAKFLLAVVEIPSEKKNRKSMFNSAGNDSDEDFEDESIKQHQLAAASDIVIVSCINSAYQQLLTLAGR